MNYLVYLLKKFQLHVCHAAWILNIITAYREYLPPFQLFPFHFHCLLAYLRLAVGEFKTNFK